MFLKFASSICRVCLGPDAKIGLFGEDGNDHKFKSTTNLQIFEDDGLPSSLCGNCSERLNSAYEFQQQSMASDVHLRTFVHTVNTKFASEIGNFQQNSQQNRGDSMISEHTIHSTNDERECEDDPNKQRTMLEIEVLPENLADNTKMGNEDESEVITLNYTYVEPLVEQSCEEAEKKEEMYVEKSANFTEGNNEEEDFLDETIRPHPSDATLCHICNKTFSSRTNLTRHILTHSDAKPFQCSVCQSAFTQKGSLKQHMLRHTGEKPHTCTMCGRGFSRKRLLSMHQRIHTGEKPFRCEDCNLCFTVKEGLRRHNIRKHSSYRGQIYTCEICDKKLHSKYTFRNHMFLHNKGGKNKISCKYCCKSFGTKQSLQTHLRIHDESAHQREELSANNETEAEPDVIDSDQEGSESEDSFLCEECNEVFISREEFLNHLKMHQTLEQMTATDDI